MNLIIKPTGACDFNCKFCSAHGMNIKHPSDGHVPEAIKELIQKLQPNSLIITGGEPLMIDPCYYYELYDIANCPIGATSNLKDFYNNPDKWKSLFNEKWFRLATSFNYGDTRMWDISTIYTESMFLSVMEKFNKYIGYIPMFLAVIDENNENTVIDHVLLAKKLNTQVKLNNAIGVGKQDKTYPRYKMFQHYIKIIDMGLEKYEYYCSTRNTDECPRNINHYCTTSLRCCYIDDIGKLHVGTCDEQLSMGNELKAEDILVQGSIPHSEIIPLSEHINEKCSYCTLFSLCNACKTNRDASKLIPDYCDEMKKLEDDIINKGWYI